MTQEIISSEEATVVWTVLRERADDLNRYSYFLKDDKHPHSTLPGAEIAVKEVQNEEMKIRKLMLKFYKMTDGYKDYMKTL